MSTNGNREGDCKHLFHKRAGPISTVVYHSRLKQFFPKSNDFSNPNYLVCLGLYLFFSEKKSITRVI